MSAGLTLEEARAIIARAVAKAEELTLSGAFVVVDRGGNVISISRMDRAPATGVGVSKAKAYIAAVAREPTLGFSARMQSSHPIFSAYQEILPEKIFPGPGGMPIVKEGEVVERYPPARVPGPSDGSQESTPAS